MSEPIDIERVKAIAHLARLKLSDQEATRLGAQLSSIVHYVAQLNEVNTEGVEPTAHPLPMVNVFRADEPREPMGAERVLANAPAADTPYFKVPKVLEQEE